jgi:hypothetical protein
MFTLERSLALAALAGVVVFAARPAAPPAQPKLVGAWRSGIAFKGGGYASLKDLEFLSVFNSGGTMTESSNYDSMPPVPPAYGVWKQTGPNRYEAKYVYYNTAAPGAFEEISKGGGWSPAGRGELIEKIALSRDGNSYESTITLDLFDKAGKRTDRAQATGHGSRIRF